MQFQDGSFCTYTIKYPSPDSNQSPFIYPILTISGIPSYIYEWKDMENSINSTWINFIIPGLDYKDERRG